MGAAARAFAFKQAVCYFSCQKLNKYHFSANMRDQGLGYCCNWTYMATCTCWNTARKDCHWFEEKRRRTQSQRMTSPSQGDNEEPKLHLSIHLFLSMPHLIFVLESHLSIIYLFICLCIYLSIFLSIASTFIKTYNVQYTAVFAFNVLVTI